MNTNSIRYFYLLDYFYLKKLVRNSNVLAILFNRPNFLEKEIFQNKIASNEILT